MRDIDLPMKENSKSLRRTGNSQHEWIKEKCWLASKVLREVEREPKVKGKEMPQEKTQRR